MKKKSLIVATAQLGGLSAFVAMALACASTAQMPTVPVVEEIKYLETTTPEETSLNLVKITDESASGAMAGKSFEPVNKKMTTTSYNWWTGQSNQSLEVTPIDLSSLSVGWFIPSSLSQTYNLLKEKIKAGKVNGFNSPEEAKAWDEFCKGAMNGEIYAWYPNRLLDISPDGTKIAYVTVINNQSNIMVRNASTVGTATQRTTRDVTSMSWGADGNLYFSDKSGSNSYICSVNAEKGSMMQQITNGNVSDENPVISQDGKTLFFTRGNAIWSIDRQAGTLTQCARGFNPCLIPGNDEAFYCIRNSTNGRSELWLVNYVQGQETLILSDSQHSFALPRLSPDGKWIVCEGNSYSNITKKQNRDIFVVKTDGSQFTQLTFHPDDDCSPVWSGDGKAIYFISSRANADKKYNVWRMNFNL